MMDSTAERAISESDLVNPVLVAMADTNSAFLKFTTSSESFLAAACSAVDDDLLLFVMMAPLRVRGVVVDVAMVTSLLRSKLVDDGGVEVDVVNACTPPW